MKYYLLIVFALCISLLSCDPSQRALLNNLKDTDQDGWYDLDRNENLDVFVDIVRIDRNNVLFDDPFSMAIDDHLIVDNSTQSASEIVATDRALGTWKLDAPEMRNWFRSELEFFSPATRFSRDNPLITSFEWNSLDSTKQLIVRAEEMTFFLELRIVKTFFPDRNSQLAEGDPDRDAITDREEAYLAKQGKRCGHPNRKDIVLLAAHTHPDWKITQNSRYILTKRFRENGYNLFIVHKQGQLSGIGPKELLPAPGIELSFGARAFHPDSALTKLAIKQWITDTTIMSFVHTCLLAQDITGGGNFGRADNVGGRDCWVESHAPIVGPDFKNFQAGLIMHEVGHTLGLCHPVSGAFHPACPDLPDEEDTNEASVMGTPVDSDGPIEVIFETLDRPINYSPNQWTQLDLRAVLLMPF